MTRPRITEWPYADPDPKFRRLDVFPRKGIPRWLGWLLFVIGVGVVVFGVVYGAWWRM
jgi:hypothetical protein